MFRRWHIHTAWTALLVAGSGGPCVRAESRTATLSVSAVVVPRCSVAATSAAVSLRCSGHAARTARVIVPAQSRQPRVRLVGPNRIDAMWRGLDAADAILVIEF